MANCNESICRNCFHSYVCEQFNENKDIKNNKCHFFNEHFVPTADVVEVVRCKDCKYFLLHKLACVYPNHNGWCTVDDYCSYGERKCDK